MNLQKLQMNKILSKRVSKTVLGLLLITAAFTACKKDDQTPEADAPTITGLEIGISNNKIGHPGSDLHVEAQIFAAGNIAGVKLSIQPKSGEGWKFDQEFTEGIVGLKNAEIHTHIDIPADAVVGNYQVKITVTDEQGQVTEVNSDLTLSADPTLPTATGFEVGLNAAGNDLHLEAVIGAQNKIAKVVVELHSGAYESEIEYTDAAMVGKTTYNLHKHVNVTAAPAGHYHVHLKIIDQSGKENEFEEHFDKR